MSESVPVPPDEYAQVFILDEDGNWYPGVLHSWEWFEGSWHGVVTYRRDSGSVHHHRCIPAERIRQTRPG